MYLLKCDGKKKTKQHYGKKSRRRLKLRHCGKFHFVRQFEMLVLAAANALNSTEKRLTCWFWKQYLQMQVYPSVLN